MELYKILRKQSVRILSSMEGIFEIITSTDYPAMGSNPVIISITEPTLVDIKYVYFYYYFIYRSC